MALIATKTKDLPVAKRCQTGRDILTKSAENPDVPGNEGPLAAFAASQAALEAANAACVAHRQESKRLTAVLKAAVAQWRIDLSGLAAVTQAITKGEPIKMYSAGFGVRAPASPTPATEPVAQIEGVRVAFNGIEGHSAITWAAEENAVAYVLECSPDPIGAGTFQYLATVSEPSYSGNGATPGVKCWYRVAGVNRLGQGPWSTPALRPVM